MRRARPRRRSRRRSTSSSRSCSRPTAAARASSRCTRTRDPRQAMARAVRGRRRGRRRRRAVPDRGTPAAPAGRCRPARGVLAAVEASLRAIGELARHWIARAAGLDLEPSVEPLVALLHAAIANVSLPQGTTIEPDVEPEGLGGARPRHRRAAGAGGIPAVGGPSRPRRDRADQGPVADRRGRRRRRDARRAIAGRLRGTRHRSPRVRADGRRTPRRIGRPRATRRPPRGSPTHAPARASRLAGRRRCASPSRSLIRSSAPRSGRC